MDMYSRDFKAFSELVVFLRQFQNLRIRGSAPNVMYPLPEVLLLCLLGVLAGAETITDIARFGAAKLALLRRFRPVAEGTPAHDHLGDILAALDTLCHAYRLTHVDAGQQQGELFAAKADGKIPFIAKLGGDRAGHALQANIAGRMSTSQPDSAPGRQGE